MRKMLLSFKPEVYEKIKSGKKIFEHRRNFPDEPIIDSKSKDERIEIVKQLQVIIFNDNSVNIGDGNRIKESNIASSIQE